MGDTASKPLPIPRTHTSLTHWIAYGWAAPPVLYYYSILIRCTKGPGIAKRINLRNSSKIEHAGGPARGVDTVSYATRRRLHEYYVRQMVTPEYSRRVCKLPYVSCGLDGIHGRFYA